MQDEKTYVLEQFQRSQNADELIKNLEISKELDFTFSDFSEVMGESISAQEVNFRASSWVRASLDVTFFDDDEWRIIEELEDPIEIDLKTTFGFFKSGMGGYVAIDYNNCANDNATLWWTNDEPRYNINFGDIVNWIVIGFEN